MSFGKIIRMNNDQLCAGRISQPFRESLPRSRNREHAKNKPMMGKRKVDEQSCRLVNHRPELFIMQCDTATLPQYPSLWQWDVVCANRQQTAVTLHPSHPKIEREIIVKVVGGIGEAAPKFANSFGIKILSCNPTCQDFASPFETRAQSGISEKGGRGDPNPT